MKKIGTVILLLALFIGGAIFFPVNKPHVQLPAEKIGDVAGFPITNTMTAAWATIIVLSLLFLFATRNMRMIPGRLQAFAEMIVETLLGLCESVAGKEKGRAFFSLVATFFLFIMISNWMGLLPGYGTIGVKENEPAHVEQQVEQSKEHSAAVVTNAVERKDGAAATAESSKGEELLLPLFRSANTDLNTTLALALVSVLATQFFGVKALGAGSYAGKFLNFKSPIDFFVGLLEIISEVAKIISFSFRLFGNIFAGEVLLGVMAFLIPWVASLPFMGLELFVGAIQAFVFMMLTLVFLTLATIGHGAEHGAEHGKAH
ncbi:MAG: F0F1 ATP synthase subunit A [Chloroflexi bacterium]|nr:F0F1 ATP synthase subunit A [Chloroflexota bacterium]MDA8188287.1 F0F1 ATP synthase subunit A [Dehalococcoidales bacterium]